MEAPACLSPSNALGAFIDILCTKPVELAGDENPFHLKHTPPISLPDFSDRLQKYFSCSSQSFVVTAIYLRRLFLVRSDIFSPQSAHKLLLTALTIGSKFTDDLSCTQSHYARCGGVDVAELNQLEGLFLNLIQFRAFVSAEEYDVTTQLLAHLCAQRAEMMACDDDEENNFTSERPVVARSSF